jgi:hypothetical protein
VLHRFPVCSGKHQVLKSFATFRLLRTGPTAPPGARKGEYGLIFTYFCWLAVLAQSMQYVWSKQLLMDIMQKGSGGLSSFAAPPAAQDGTTRQGSRR